MLIANDNESKEIKQSAIIGCLILNYSKYLTIPIDKPIYTF